jgi:hypothetical protein
MGKAIEITHLGRSAAELRELAARTRDGAVVRRLLGIAMLLDGWSRGEAATASGMDRQCRWRPEPAHKPRWVKIWHEICRNATSAEGLNGRPPVNAVSRRRRWPKASVYSGFYRSGTMGTGVGAQAA